jgi:hypothetical protein
VAERWFYLCNDDGRLPTFMHPVILGAEERWKWGLPQELHTHLKSLLEALQKLRDHGLTAAGVVVAFHWWWVLPLADRRLRLNEMTPEASVESSRMASATLSTDELLQRLKGMVGNADYSIVVLMCPEQGYMSLVCPLFFVFCFWFFIFISVLHSRPLDRGSEASGPPDPRF